MTQYYHLQIFKSLYEFTIELNTKIKISCEFLLIDKQSQKKIINKIEKGFDFIGSVNKYKRVLPRQKTINKIMNMIKK